MHEPITIVRKRKKDGTVGDWEILVQPDESMAKHLEARESLMKAYPVNEEIAELQTARLEPIQNALRFQTSAEQKASLAESKKQEAKFTKESEDAVARQKKLESDAAKVEAEKHAAKVAAMNKMHDAIREKK